MTEKRELEMPTRTAIALNIAALTTLAIGASALWQSPMDVRSMVLPWPVLRGLLVFAAAVNVGSILMLVVRALRTDS